MHKRFIDKTIIITGGLKEYFQILFRFRNHVLFG